MTHERHDLRPITPDDPRLSEWIDGRLPPAEAAAVETMVAASPELTRLAADLRAAKAALGNLPPVPPPASFVRDVLAALDGAVGEMADDAEVEAEWRRLERERLEEEIAEARDDAAEPNHEPMRQRWPWLALAGALAAGVLATVLIDRLPAPRDGEVAMVETDQAGAETPVDAWVPEEAEPTAAAEPPPDGQPVRLVTVAIRGAEDRRRLEALLEASGLETTAEDPAGEDLAENRARRLAAEAGTDAVVAERIAVTGPGPVIEALAAALEARDFLAADKPAAAAAATRGAAPQTAAGQVPAAKPGSPETESGGGDGSPMARLTIMILDESAAEAAREDGP